VANETPDSGRIDPAEHHDPTWHINDVAHDFDLIDAWKLPVGGTYEEFGELPKLFLSIDFGEDEGSKLSELLFAARDKLGDVFGWDQEVLTLPIPGCSETSLRDRLAPELKASAQGLDVETTDFQVVYQTENESAMELSNSTVHAAIHFAWLKDSHAEDIYFGQMGIYVKTRGTLGRFYMPAIAPFRHYVVYPALMRRLRSAWSQR